ncbi:hypothetical protein CLV92_12018 [Kineococcus xinjiangensis]|uniref:Uncharacterized protein n=2 Tax=Kineococcus xinjiangensis TaxID=512762 RepID=A0A2S6ICH2_9ACTN|nr:hypothetical protein CLV92_12018 [Kineococcus xinjiangensis]
MTASVVTDYAKLILTYMALTMDIHLDEGDRPLERTKKMRPAGERRRLHARLRYDTGKPEVANCLKLLTGFSGIDVSLPDSGPVAGAIFGFVGVQGFPGATAEQTKSALVQFYGGNPRMRLSDAKGETSIGVEGLGQRQKISEAASPVDKTASVRVEVVLKRANMWRDLKDAVDAASDLIPGPIDYVVTDGKPTPGGASFLKVPVELLMRTRWIAFRHQFTVRDWSTNWRLVGKITVKQQREYKYTFSEGYDNDVQDNRLDLDLNLTQSMGNLDSSLVLFDLEGRDSTEMTKWGGPAKFRQTYAASYEHVGKRYVFTRTEHGRNPVKPPAGTGIASVLWTGGDEVLLRLDLHTPYPVGTYKQLAKWPEKEERKEGKLGQPDWFKDPPSRLPILHGTVSTDGVTGEAVFDFDSSMYIAPGPRWNGGNDSSSETIEVSGSLRLVAAP